MCARALVHVCVYVCLCACMSADAGQCLRSHGYACVNGRAGVTADAQSKLSQFPSAQGHTLHDGFGH